MKHQELTIRIRKVAGWSAEKIRPFRKGLVVLGNLGITAGLVLLFAVKFYRREFLPLIQWGVVNLGISDSFVLAIFWGSLVSGLMAGVATLLLWTSLPARSRIAGLMPAMVIFLVWLIL